MSSVATIESKDLTAVAPTTPATLLQLAVEQGADLDRLEKLMDLQQRWEDDEARKAFTEAMTEFRATCPAIDKNKKGHNSSYATLAHTLSLVKEHLSKNGLSHNWKTEQTEGLITVTCCVTHKTGYRDCTSMNALADTSGSKNSIQAIGSTVTYLQRYTLFAILGLASSDQDDDGNTSDGDNAELMTSNADWIKRMKIIRESFDSISDFKDRMSDEDYPAAAEIFLNFDEDQLWALRLAPTKGGVLTTKEMGQLNCNEFFAAKSAINGFDAKLDQTES